MAARKKSAGSKRGQPASATEYRFVIDAYTPDTIPMARLAEYMADLALILGETPAVHFNRLEAGSTVMVQRIEREAVPKVLQRTAQVRSGDAPSDAQRAFRSLNKKLREDNAVAALTQGKRGAKILFFPGREEAAEELASVRQHGHLDGTIVRIGGTDSSAHVILESEGQQVVGINTDRAMAKRLAAHLFDTVRLQGMGTWARDSAGCWNLRSFRVTHFEALDTVPLSDALAQIRALNVRWPSVDDLTKLRQG